jgi:hypothetical protein
MITLRYKCLVHCCSCCCCCCRTDSQGPKSPSTSTVSSSGSGRLQALFTVSRGLLVLLLPRELLLFDTALGAPAASTVLPANMSAFSSLLGVYGSGVCQGGGDDGGVDFLYTLHTGGCAHTRSHHDTYRLDPFHLIKCVPE